MASVLVKNLPSASAINGTDLVIVNIGEGEEYVTSNMSIAEFKSALNGSITGDNTFASDVKVSGNVQIIKEESKFIGDLTGTATFVSTLSPFTTADLPSDGFNLYFTSADAVKLADLRTDLNALSVRVDNVATAVIGLENGKVDKNTADIATETQQRLATDTNHNDRLVLLESISRRTDQEIKDLAQVVTDETLDATLPDYSTTAEANALYQPISTASNTVDGNATDIATNATAIGTEETRAKAKEAEIEASVVAENTAMLAAVKVVQDDVDANETSLSGRLDILEADPTTATAVAAVDTKVDTKVSKTTSITFNKIAGADGTNAAAVDALNAAVEALIDAMKA